MPFSSNSNLPIYTEKVTSLTLGDDPQIPDLPTRTISITYRRDEKTGEQSYLLTASLDIIDLPDAWKAQEGKIVPVIKINRGQHTLTEVIYTYQKESQGFFAQANTFI